MDKEQLQRIVDYGNHSYDDGFYAAREELRRRLAAIPNDLEALPYAERVMAVVKDFLP